MRRYSTRRILNLTKMPKPIDYSFPIFWQRHFIPRGIEPVSFISGFHLIIIFPLFTILVKDATVPTQFSTTLLHFMIYPWFSSNYIAHSLTLWHQKWIRRKSVDNCNPQWSFNPKRLIFVDLCKDLIDYFIVCFEHQCNTVHAFHKAA